MRSPDEIQSRIRTLLLAELDRRVKLASERLPHRCQHNHRQPLDARKEIAGENNDGYNRVDRTRLPVVPSIGLCLLGAEDPVEWQGNICEDPVDAQRCPYFNPTQGKDEILAEFTQQIEDIQWVAENLPEVHALLWVLDAAAANFQLPWWKRIWFGLLRIRTEPVREASPQLLLKGTDGVHGP